LLCGSRYQAFDLTNTIADKVVHQKGNIFQPRATVLRVLSAGVRDVGLFIALCDAQ